MKRSKKNYKLVNNTGQNLGSFEPILTAAVDAGELPEDYRDIFTLKILKGFNADGSDRGVLTMFEEVEQ